MTYDERESLREQRQSLVDAIRVGECALANARADIRALDVRLARCREIIEEQTRMIAEFNHRAAEAPAKIERIEAALAKQRQELEALGSRVANEPSERSSNVKRRDELLARLARGDTTVVGELTKLAQQMGR